ncbi:E3 SUMO-protein ligase ZBED1-like [Ixodes scapularis]|uniref:E3 SUMO-protein ligase ZBED1-like n=1 Tax=Ixodes scapularis TaxID=6945 RepID=UPI001A9F36EB|nr:E3 SUMO-protein ligase ZBED1-like [Ixodes scapularis]
MPKSKAEIWDYFVKDATSGYAKCTLCKKEYKTSGNTSNLRDHMKRCHAGSSFHQDREEREPEEVGDSRMAVAGPSRPKQSKLHLFVAEKATQYGDQTEKKNKLDKELALMIAKDMQPFSIVTDKGFQGLCHALDPRYKLPSRTQISRVLLLNLYDEAKTRLRDMLTEARECAITADMWTSCTTDSYVTVTCHFVQDTVLRSAVLSTAVVHEDHTAENVAQAIAGVAED